MQPKEGVTGQPMPGLSVCLLLSQDEETCVVLLTQTECACSE